MNFSWDFSKTVRIGLKSEIFLNLFLLASAALLFSGFLLIRFAEQELVSQSVILAEETVRGVLRGVTAGNHSPEMKPDVHIEKVRTILQQHHKGEMVRSWELYDDKLMIVAEFKGNALAKRGKPSRWKLNTLAEIEIDIKYPPSLVAFFSADSDYHGDVIVSAPLRQGRHSIGLLVMDFSLDHIPERIRAGLASFFGYALVAVLVVIGSGVYFLGRNVVRPVERLVESTRMVAQGNLEHEVEAEGPRELACLADSFNTMVGSLKQKRQETEKHIERLQASNKALQETREELVRSEKMASVGHLAAGMAHEIGNPLGAVQGYLDFLRGGNRDDVEKDIIERSLSEIERINRLVRDLLDYASPQRTPEELFDPAELVREAMNILQSQSAFEGLEVVDGLPPSLPAVRMSRHKFIQVMINLLLNARDATSGAGVIMVTGGEEGASAWISVGDTGEGIKKENLRQVFDPFFTTKKAGKGRGLGLSVCQRILKEAGGRIDIQSEEGVGTVFKVVLAKMEHSFDEKEVCKNISCG
ncbi:MAG: HAMP domain-containing protein [Deltaproteobacteria bacterium]|nr:HAMP domain-containing protein [Deltaproteobacteria bacterium]